MGNGIWGDSVENEPAFYESNPVPEYQTITITGGTDATNTNLIAWLDANATRIS